MGVRPALINPENDRTGFEGDNGTNQFLMGGQVPENRAVETSDKHPDLQPPTLVLEPEKPAEVQIAEVVEDDKPSRS